MIKRRLSKQIRIGDVTVGGDAPIRVQSMVKANTRDTQAVLKQLGDLKRCGCEIARVAIPDFEAVQALSIIRKASSIPLIADVHFDHRLALASLEAGVDGLRLNPGNIQDHEHIAKIVKAAGERQVPIRIGVNSGSLPPPSKLSSPVVSRMVKAALDYVEILENLGFDLIKISLKAFDVPTTVAAYQNIARKTIYPLHIGITEAGLPESGMVRSAVGIGILLYQGIGDTIRVSLSADPCLEVNTAYEVLKSLNLREHGPTLVSCPSCGRTEVDIVSLAEQVNERLKTVSKPIKIAVMGCVVNGPGEAKDADVGIACGKGKGAIFKKGKVVGSVDETDFLTAIMKEIHEIVGPNGKK